MAKFKLRRGTSAEWAATDPVLAEGEPGFDRSTGRLKIGDGLSSWSELDYFAPFDSDAAAGLPEHINSENPHPVYDDGPSFTLLYENAKV